MKTTLKLAGIYNLIWGAWVVLFPEQFFELAKLEPLNHIVIWQGMGMVIGVYGLGYWWASSDPVRHWPIVAVGFLGKVLGPLGFLYGWLFQEVPSGFFLMNISNDIIWWIPFFLILQKAHQNGWKLKG